TKVTPLRVAVQEPSVEPTCTHPGHGKRLHVCELPPIEQQGEPTCRHEACEIDSAGNSTRCADCGATEGLASVQGEPTDAQVQAFVTAINAEGFVLDRRAVKAGLRAA